MALKDDLLPLVDDLRGIAGQLGFRPYEVYVRVTTFSGPRVGLGAATLSETRLLVGGQNPKVRAIRSKDTVAGTAEFSNDTWEIGPLTPSFPGGGYTPEAINPAGTATPATTLYVLKGPGLPAAGLLCQRTEDDVDRPLRAVIRVRSTGRRSA